MVYVRAVPMQFFDLLKPVVTVHTKGLEVVGIPEQGSVAPMWGTVVYH